MCLLPQQWCLQLTPKTLHAPQLIGNSSAPTNVFGVELHHLVEKESAAVPIPLLIQKCVKEIEVRGLRVGTIVSA